MEGEKKEIKKREKERTRKKKKETQSWQVVK